MVDLLSNHLTRSFVLIHSHYLCEVGDGGGGGGVGE